VVVRALVGEVAGSLDRGFADVRHLCLILCWVLNPERNERWNKGF